MLEIAIVVGSTRPGRKAEKVARWVEGLAGRRGDARFEVVDILDYELPLLDEPVPPSMDKYSKPHTKKWAAKIAQFDGYVFVTPEYNHGTSGALKNAIDFLFKEWNDKAAAFVSYGSAGGVRAVEQLRCVMGEVKIADVRTGVQLMLATDFADGEFRPHERHEKTLGRMLDELLQWAGALKTIRK
jgi:NAD(P)H-dependent FMN reductase